MENILQDILNYKNVVIYKILIQGKSHIWFPWRMTQRISVECSLCQTHRAILKTDNSGTLPRLSVLFRFGNGSYLGEFYIGQMFLCLGR